MRIVNRVCVVRAYKKSSKRHCMISNIEQFYTEGKSALEKLNVFFGEVGLIGLVQADHICFKCESSDEFENMRRMFESNSHYLFQSIISKRRISLVKFITSFETVVGPICILELSDQKPDGSQTSGFDHIEVYPVGKSVEDIVKFLQEKGIVVEKEAKSHHTTWDFFVDGFRVRIEECPLMEKVVREEIFS